MGTLYIPHRSCSLPQLSSQQLVSVGNTNCFDSLLTSQPVLHMRELDVEQYMFLALYLRRDTSSSIMPIFFFNQSFATFCFPICLYKSSSNSSVSFSLCFRLSPNCSSSPCTACCFHCLICVVWTPYRLANSAIVRVSLIASRATFALNAGECTRRNFLI